MAFRKLDKPGRATPTQAPQITIARNSGTHQVYLSLNKAARASLGDPAAVHFEWDDEACLLRIVASSPDDPAAYRLGRHGRVTVTGMIRDLGLHIGKTMQIPARRDTRVSTIADLSDVPVAGVVTPIKATA